MIAAPFIADTLTERRHLAQSALLAILSAQAVAVGACFWIIDALL